jgi:hypothetical protein|tara:strand:- start:3488 stop:3877 length:390 start_codon:yes stop_codon:yes gene_type:complete
MSELSTLANQQNGTSAVAPTNISFDLVEKAKNLENMEASTPVSTDYMELGDGEQVRTIFMGFGETELAEGGIKECGYFYHNNTVHVNVGYVLVRTLKALSIKQGTPIEVTCTGRGKDGRTKEYSVALLS